MRTQVKHIALAYLLVLCIGFTPTMAISTDMPRITVTEIKTQKLTQFISTKYRVDRGLVENIVKKAYNFQHTSFPTAIDILAIIAIESSFNKYAVSKVNAKGVMQIYYKPTSFDIHENMKDGVTLLKEYSSVLNQEGAVEAYNLGIGNYRSGMRNKEYLNKFKTIKQQLESV